MSEMKPNLPTEKPSKSQRKRDMIALQKLGEELVDLPLSQLKKFPLSEKLYEAIIEARSLNSHEAKRRQVQYIGRLMRDEDPKPIEDSLAKIQHRHQQDKVQFHKTERWRDKLIKEGDKALQEFLIHFNMTDDQHLRQLVHHAEEGKRGADTELFRYLRQIIEDCM